MTAVHTAVVDDRSTAGAAAIPDTATLSAATTIAAAGTIAAALSAAARTLATRSESPRLDAEILLAGLLGISRTALIVRGAEPIAVGSRSALEALIARRLAGAPVAYLTGLREFWSLELAVTPDVLVPRPETEVLVEVALSRLSREETRAVLDLGTGSGAVALAIASERPLARVIGADVSAPALSVARANAQKLRLPQVDWRLGSWFEAVPGERFDVIVANPPYVATNDPALAALAAEPAIALSSGPTGLEALSAIVEGAGRHLNAEGWLILEHGGTQAAAVARLLARCGFRHIRSQADYAGHPRVTLATLFHHSRHLQLGTS